MKCLLKISGIEWNLFYSDKTAWPKGAWHEEEKILIDGREPDIDLDLSSVPNYCTLDITGGIFYRDGNATEGISLVNHIRKWRKKQSTTVFVIEVPNHLAELMRASVQAGGGKVMF